MNYRMQVAEEEMQQAIKDRQWSAEMAVWEKAVFDQAMEEHDSAQQAVFPSPPSWGSFYDKAGSSMDSKELQELIDLCSSPAGI